MYYSRITIASLLGVVLFFGIVFARLRSGSNDWFKLIYTLTFLTLVYAAIATRYRGPFWYGFAIAGWAYFMIGFGPWIGSPPGSEPLRAVNRNLVTSVILEIVSGALFRDDVPPPGPALFPMMVSQMHSANRDGMGHCTLTILFAVAGGFVSRALSRRRCMTVSDPGAVVR
jgi:hypothetical protein